MPVNDDIRKALGEQGVRKADIISTLEMIDKIKRGLRTVPEKGSGTYQRLSDQLSKAVQAFRKLESTFP